MGFNIKNNYGPNIEVKDGGRLTLTQGKNGLWHTVDAEEVEYEEVTAPQVPQKYEIFPLFSLKHFEICPKMRNFALEIKKHFEEWMQIIAYSKGSSMSGC